MAVSVSLIYFFNKIEYEEVERQDFISVMICLASGIFLTFIPIFMTYRLYNIKDLLEDDDTVEENEYILSNIQTLNIYQASYNIVFCLRRALIIISLYTIEDDKVALKLAMNIAIQFAYLMYICSHTPL